MSANPDNPTRSHDQPDLKKGSDINESEIAYFLQNCQPGDFKIVEILVKVYAEELYWLIQFAFFERFGRKPSLDTVKSLLVQTFVHAVQYVDRFWGEDSVRNWLFARGVKSVRGYKPRITTYTAVRSAKSIEDGLRLEKSTGWPAGGNSPEIDSLRSYLKKNSLLLHLRYVLQLEIHDIASILGLKVERVHSLLTHHRSKLLKEDPSKDHDPGSSHPVFRTSGGHKFYRSLIQKDLDGLLEENNREEIALRNHLSTCESCRVYAGALEQRLRIFAGLLKEYWPRPHLTDDDLKEFTRIIKANLFASKKSFHVWGTLRKGVWMGVVMLIFAAGVFTLMRLAPERGEFPASPPTPQRNLPTPLSPDPGTFSEDVQDYQEYSPNVGIFAFEPGMSADGRWVVFSSTASYPGDLEMKDHLNVMLYDTLSQTVERIASQVLPYNQMEFPFTAPAISANGRWIVYNGLVDVIEDGSAPCLANGGIECEDIILYDHMERQHTRITQSYNGGVANNDSVLPSISANGRWIVFWSTASNLVDDDPVWCEGDGENVKCANIYIYDQVNEEIERLPIGRSVSSDFDFQNALDVPDISDDGRWVLLTLRKSDRISDQAGLSTDLDVYLYDRLDNVFEPLNITQDGTPGDGVSALAEMTPDGQYIVFNSSSGNLIPGDDNNSWDVFLRDRSNGEIKLVSRAPDGSSADADSNLGMGVWTISDISIDGRYTVFISTAGDLDPESPVFCSTSEANFCINTYIYDNLSGDIERISTNQDNSLALQPSISQDGRWISYMEVNYDCGLDVCVDMSIFDREREWVNQVTRKLFPRAGADWKLHKTFEIEAYNPLDMEFSPDGKSIALIGNDGSVELISVLDGENIFTLSGNTGSAIISLAYSPDGSHLAGGAIDGSVNIWRVSDGSLAYLLEDHPGRIIDLQFSHNGGYLYAVTPSAVWTWERADRRYTRINSMDYKDVYIKGVDFSQTNDLMAIVPSKEHSIWLLSLSNGEVMHRLAGYGTNSLGVTFAPDGKYLLARFNYLPLQLWEFGVDAYGSITPKYIRQIDLQDPSKDVVFSGDGEYAAVGSIYDGVQIIKIPGGQIVRLRESYEIGSVSSITFSPTGNLLAVASRYRIYLWQKTSTIDAPQFFSVSNTDEFIQIPNRRRPFANAEMYLGLDRIAMGGMTLYQTDDQTPFDVFAPIKLPANIKYLNTSLMQNGSVTNHYRQDNLLTGEPLADLYFQQQFNSDDIRMFRVGASAILEKVEFSGRTGEYVRGDWLSIPEQREYNSSYQDINDLHWTWSSEVDIQQLRWRNVDQLFSLTYIPREITNPAKTNSPSNFEESTFQQLYLTKYDLVEIAGGVSGMKNSLPSDEILIDYIVKPGDTCTAIAFKYGTTVGTLTRVNDLSDNCDLITVGQALRVPLPAERLPFTEIDLDCDGLLERLQIVPTPVNINSNISYGIILETQSDVGLYRKKWQYTLAEADAEYMVRPQLLPINTCQHLIAVNVMGALEENQSGLKVFRWDHGSMDLIFTAGGWLQAVTDYDGSLSLSTLQLEFISGTSTCNRITSIYNWDGEGFLESMNYVEEGGSCGLR